jgi:serine/threonine protein kinase/tetratricopeptide (TPR) repeat protein
MDGCPSPERLRCLLDGGLDEAEYAALEAHVESCAACQGGLERRSGELVRALWQGWLDGLPLTSPARRPGSWGDPDRTGSRAFRFPPPIGPGSLGRLDGYVIEAELGRGAMGAVFRAHDDRLDRRVAIKVPWPELSTLESFRLRFEREARAAAAGVHDHVVQIHQVGDGTPDFPLPYLVMELVEGGSLGDRLDRERRLPPREAAEIARQVALALAAAHGRGLVHRDIKPGNVMLERGSGRAKLTDFGLARAVDGVDAQATHGGGRAGSPAYMSPEAINTPSQCDGRSDLFSLAVVLYEMLTGERPFRGATPAMVMRQVAEEEPLAPRRIDERIPRDLETICLKAMAKDPTHRYPTAAALADDLGRFLGGRPVLARPLGPVARLWRWCRRRPTTAGLIMALALVTIAGFAGVTIQWRRAEAHLADAERQRDRFGRVWSRAQRRSLFLVELLRDERLDSSANRPIRKRIAPQVADHYRGLIADLRGDPRDRRDLAEVRYHFARFLVTEGSWELAIREYQAAVELLVALDREGPADAESTSMLAQIYWCSADARRRAGGDPRGQELDLRRCLESYNRLLQKDPNLPGIGEKIAAIVLGLGSLQCDAGRLDEAIQSYGQAVELYVRILHDQPDDFRLRDRLARIYRSLGIVQRNAAEPDEALRSFERARELWEDLDAEGPVDIPLLRNLVQVTYWVGALQYHADRAAGALTVYRRAAGLYAKLLLRDQSRADEYRMGLSASLHNVGNILADGGRPDEALGPYRQALALRDALAREHLDDPARRGDLEATRRNLAEALARLGREADPAPGMIPISCAGVDK